MRFGRQNVGRWGAIGLVAALLGICAGCGGSSLATVQGTVTFDGEPVQQGSIAFEPADGVGPVAGGMIEGGKYVLAGETGVTPGKKIVRITATRSTGKKIEAGPPEPEGTMVDEIVSFIPEIYNQKSTLTVEVATGEATHNFELKSQ
ncbi:MAG: hypothetical protein ACOX1P_13580 [Thermoguttaceae bacterium]|jgi:hypothetical protein